MRKLFYMGLEPYEGRYTLQLQEWSERVFKKKNIDYVVVPGTTIDNTKSISVGQVLDAVKEAISKKPSRTAELVTYHHDGPLSKLCIDWLHSAENSVKLYSLEQQMFADSLV